MRPGGAHMLMMSARVDIVGKYTGSARYRLNIQTACPGTRNDGRSEPGAVGSEWSECNDTVNATLLARFQWNLCRRSAL
mgnify:CR=1 FL=1